MAVAGRPTAAEAARAEFRVASDNTEPSSGKVFRQSEPVLAISTRHGVVGVLNERGVVLAVRHDDEAGTGELVYRRHTGAEMSLAFSGAMPLAVDDLIVVKSLTLPDGAVRPVAVRSYAGHEWTAIDDADAIIASLGGKGRAAYTSAGVGLGTVAAAGLFSSLAMPICAAGAALSLGIAWTSRQRAERDRRAIRKLLTKR